jgi:transcriptional regulator with XRE-family HTH domain
MRDRRHAFREAVAEEVRAAMGRGRGRGRVSQTALAAALEMSQSALSRRLAGDQPFDVDELEKIADYFDVPVSSLLPATLPTDTRSGSSVGRARA